MTSRTVHTIAYLAFLIPMMLTTTTAFAVSDGFEGYAVGATALPNWSLKWAADSTQQDLFSVVEAGRTGQGLGLDVSVAERLYGGVHNVGLTGDKITLRSDVKFGISGEPLDGSGTGAGAGLSGVNDPFVGIAVRTTPNWWGGTGFGFGLSRRADGFWGSNIPAAPWISGWNENILLGFEDNTGVEATSDWFTMEISFFGTGDVYDADFHVYNADGELLWDSFAALGGPVLTTIPVGTPLYGGFSTGWTNFADTEWTDPDGTVPSVGDNSKVSSVVIDNYSFVGPPVAGDYNQNQAVDAADFTVWRDTLGAVGGDLAADGTADDLLGVPDGDVDNWDGDFWNVKFGNTLSSGANAASVPEPGTCTLMLLMLLGWSPGRRRQAA